MEIAYTLRLPRDPATVPLVRTICRDAMSWLGVTLPCRGDVALALTEACANAVLHAGTDEYEVEVQLGEEWCDIRVIDAGRGLDRADLEADMPDGSRAGGRGIALMRLLVDRLQFESRPEVGTVVHLQKQLDLEGSA